MLVAIPFGKRNMLMDKKKKKSHFEEGLCMYAPVFRITTVEEGSVIKSHFN